MKNTPKNIAIEKLFPFEGHPFKVQDNEEMNALIESIQEQGILSPLIVRPKKIPKMNMKLYRDTDGSVQQLRQG